MSRKKSRQAEPRPVEFSKIIVILGISMWLIVNIFGMVMMAITRNLSPMVYIIASVDAVMACLTGWYSWKARAENIIKLKMIYGIDVSNLETEITAKHNRKYYREDDYYDDGPMYEDTSIV